MDAITPAVRLKVGFKGEYRLVLRNKEGRVVKETGWFDNHLLDNYFDWLCGKDFGSSTWSVVGCHVGAGNTPPADGDTQLESFLGGTTTIQSTTAAVDSTARWSRQIITYRMAAGVGTGNIAELGIALGTSAAPGVANSAGNSTQPLVSRELVRDEFGDPVVITKLADDVLDIQWRLTKYAPAADVAGTFIQDIDGVNTNFDYIVRPSRTETSERWSATAGHTGNIISPTLGTTGSIGNFGSGFADGGIGGVFTAMSGGAAFASSISFIDSQVDGQWWRDVRLFAALTNNNRDINAAKFNFGVCGFMMSLEPVVAKVASKEYRLDVRLSVGRYSP